MGMGRGGLLVGARRRRLRRGRRGGRAVSRRARRADDLLSGRPSPRRGAGGGGHRPGATGGGGRRVARTDDEPAPASPMGSRPGDVFRRPVAPGRHGRRIRSRSPVRGRLGDGEALRRQQHRRQALRGERPGGREDLARSLSAPLPPGRSPGRRGLGDERVHPGQRSLHERQRLLAERGAQGGVGIRRLRGERLGARGAGYGGGGARRERAGDARSHPLRRRPGGGGPRRSGAGGGRRRRGAADLPGPALLRPRREPSPA